MIWCNLMLNKYPEVSKRIRDELQTVLPRLFEDRDYVANMDDMDLLIYLEAFVRETLRLYPIGPMNMRIAIQRFRTARSLPRARRSSSHRTRWAE